MGDNKTAAPVFGCLGLNLQVAGRKTRSWLDFLIKIGHHGGMINYCKEWI